MYPNAGESVVTWAPPRPLNRRAATFTGGERSGAEGEQAAENAARSLRRAVSTMRRFSVENQLTRYAVFTFAEPVHDRRMALREWRRMSRLISRMERTTGKPMPWLMWLELHPGGHGYHLNLLVGGKWLHQRAWSEIWGRGRVYIEKIRTRRGAREDARAAARYAVAYAEGHGKVLGEGRTGGEHRYEVSQGHQPLMVRCRAWEAADGRVEAIRAMGGEVPAYEWESGQAEDWRGPPVLFMSWR